MFLKIWNGLVKNKYCWKQGKLLTKTTRSNKGVNKKDSQLLNHYVVVLGIFSFICRHSRSSTCALTGFFWLLSHVIYLKLTKVSEEFFLSQTEWWIVKGLFLSVRPESWTFWKLNFVNPLRFTSHQKNLRKLFTF